MVDDDDQVCGCIILLAMVYGLYRGFLWALDKYGWESIAAVSSCILALIVVSVIISKVFEEAYSLTEKGKAFIKFSFIWFVLVFIISNILDIWLTSSSKINGGDLIFTMTLLVSMPGVLVLSFNGAKKLKSSDIETKVVEAKNIINFGIFWLIFWAIFPRVLMYYGIIVSKDPTSEYLAFLLIVAIPGSIVNIIIGKWLSKIDVKQGWEELAHAKKLFDKEKVRLDEQKRQIDRETSEVSELKAQLSRERKELDKESKELQKIKNDTNNKIKVLEVQQKDISKARDELESTWNQLKDTIDKNPFKLFIKEKLNKDVFVKEIEELKKARPGDISSIRTKADSVILGIHEELKREISTIEDEYYVKAFYEHFKKSNGDLTEYDRIRTRYNPTIHVQVDRRNKEWAEKRRFELSKIEKSMKEEMSMKTGK